MPVPKNPAVMEKFKGEQQLPVQLRVLNVLKSWTEKYFLDFAYDKQLAQILFEFANTNTSRHSAALKQIVKKLKQKLSAYRSGEYTKKPTIQPPTGQTPPVHPIQRKGAKIASIYDFHAEEIARQMCLYDFALFSQIQPLELMNKVYETERRKAINYLRFTRRTQTLRNWAIQQLVHQQGAGKDRKLILTILIDIASYSYDLRNFHAVKSLLSGLQSSEVQSLTQTWESLDSATSKKYEKLLAAEKSSFSSLKVFQSKYAGDSVEDPGIPIIELFVKEIVNIEEKDNNFIDNNLINASKSRQLNATFSDLNRFRNVPYNFEQQPWIQNYIQVDLEKFAPRTTDNLEETSISNIGSFFTSFTFFILTLNFSF